MRAGTHCRLLLGIIPMVASNCRARSGLRLEHTVRRGHVEDDCGMRITLNIQAIFAAAAAVLGYFYGGMPAALAALFGAGIALSNTLLLVWRLHRGKRQVHADAHRHLRSFYFSTFERFFVVGGLLAVGLGALQLTPLPLLAAFVAGQMAWMISGLTSGNN